MDEPVREVQASWIISKPVEPRMTRRELLRQGITAAVGTSAAVALPGSPASSRCNYSDPSEPEESNEHYGVPSGKNVVLIDAIGGLVQLLEPNKSYYKWIPLVQECFNVKRLMCDYKLTVRNSAKVEDLLNLPDDIAVMIYTNHGIRRGENFVGIQTNSNIPSTSWPTELTADPDMLGRTSEGFYYVTPKFIRTYWKGKFCRNSFVCMNLCDSFQSAEFRRAVFDVGVSVYAGWTHGAEPKTACFTMAYLFDWLLGANVERSVEKHDREIYDPETEKAINDVTQRIQKKLPSLAPHLSIDFGAVQMDLTKETPPQRPFDWDEVRQDMNLKGLGFVYDGTTDEISMLEFDASGLGDFGLLRPSIAGLMICEDDGTMVISGMFGHRPLYDRAEVTVDGRAVQIDFEKWSQYAFTCCGLPISGPGSCGDVVVSISGKQSNPVPLTSWRGDVFVTVTGPGVLEPGLSSALHLRTHLRGYIHDFRSYPGEKKISGTQMHQFGLALDSNASYLNQGADLGKGLQGSILYTYDGSGDLRILTICGSPSDADNYVNFYCPMSDNRKPKLREAHKAIFYASIPVTYTENVVGRSPAEGPTKGSISVVHDFINTLPFDPSYNIGKFQVTAEQVMASRPYDVKGEIRWDKLAVEANSAPTADTEA